jgi:hypothetical protein
LLRPTIAILIHISLVDWKVRIDLEHEPRATRRLRSVVLELRDRKTITFGNPTVAMGHDSEVEIATLGKLEASVDRTKRGCGEALHDDGLHLREENRVFYDLPALFVVPIGAGKENADWLIAEAHLSLPPLACRALRLVNLVPAARVERDTSHGHVKMRR